MTVPDDVPPKKVETAPGAAPAEVRHVARAEDLREGTEADDRVLALLVGVLHAEDLCLELDDADGSDWKPPWRDGRVDPVVAAVTIMF